MTPSENFLRELRELSHLAVPAPEVDLREEKNPLYIAGYSTGYRDALAEVWGLVEVELSD